MGQETELREVIHDNIRTGLTTANALDHDPPSLRVSWIAWDSGFRGSGLQIGDHIIAVDGERVSQPATLPDLQRAIRELPGGLGESAVWAARGLKDGSALTLTIRRRRYPGEGWLTLDVTGKVLAERTYSYPTGRRAMGATGPDGLANDGFDGPWSSWYEKRVFDWTRVLDGGWDRSRFDTRRALADHLEARPRVDWLAEQCPGPFAAAVQADWVAVRNSLEGTRYLLDADALDYRAQEAERVEEVRKAATDAWNAYLAAHAGEVVAPFPSVDPFRGDRSHLVGKLVALPPLGPRDWLVSIDTPYLAATDGSYWYFAATQSPAMRRVFMAANRYKRFVSPAIREEFALIGRIMPDPRMMTAHGRTVAGLQIEPLAALVGNAMFVDLSLVRGEESPFAGEDALKKQPSGLPAPHAAPREVLEALVAALKANDQATWNALFADWRLVTGEGRPLYYAYHPYPFASRDEDWIRSRRQLLDTIYDVRVVWLSETRVVLHGDEFEGAPRIDEVRAEIEHIGLFDGEYRAFNGAAVHRLWTLQRRDGGAWRISSYQGI